MYIEIFILLLIVCSIYLNIMTHYTYIKLYIYLDVTIKYKHIMLIQELYNIR